jgi:flagellar protein FliS
VEAIREGDRKPTQRAHQKYQSQLIETATPERCVVMLYERLVDDVERADEIFESSDFKPVFDILFHAQSIIRLLRSAMRTDIWPEGANLVALYNWFEQRISQAAMFQDRQALRECIPLIRQLAAAWAEAYDRVASTKDAAAGGERGSPGTAFSGTAGAAAFAETRAQIADFLA